MEGSSSTPLTNWQFKFSKINSMKEKYYAELKEQYEWACQGCEQYAMLPEPQKQLEMLDKFEKYKNTLAKFMHFFEQPIDKIVSQLKEKLPQIEKQIIVILSFQRRRNDPSQPFYTDQVQEMNMDWSSAQLEPSSNLDWILENSFGSVPQNIINCPPPDNMIQSSFTPMQPVSNLLLEQNLQFENSIFSFPSPSPQALSLGINEDFDIPDFEDLDMPDFDIPESSMPSIVSSSVSSTDNNSVQIIDISANSGHGSGSRDKFREDLGTETQSLLQAQRSMLLDGSSAFNMKRQLPSVPYGKEIDSEYGLDSNEISSAKRCKTKLILQLED